MEHGQNTAGALMVTEYPAVAPGLQVRAAREALLALGEIRYDFNHVFVLDGDRRLVGQVNMIDLALAEDDTPIAEISAPIVGTVTVGTSAAECARLRRHYDVSQLGVVDGEGRLMGVIPAEYLLNAVVSEDTRQMLKVAAAPGESLDGSLPWSIKSRLPWLTVNLGTTFLAVATIALFESTLTRIVVLAAFLPVVAGQGGIGGTQTLTLIVRGIAMGGLVGVKAQRILAREATLGALHGLFLGVLVAGIAYLWQQNVGLSLVLGLAMWGNMLLAGAVGAAVPLFLRRVGVDPAVASAVVVTTFTEFWPTPSC